MPRKRQTKTTPTGVSPDPPGRSRSQPVREIPTGTGQSRGQNADLQQAAPLAVAGPSPAAQGQPQPTPQDVFAPTAFPEEPITSGIPLGPGQGGEAMLPEDPDMLIRAMISVYPDPDLIGLLRAEGA